MARELPGLLVCQGYAGTSSDLWEIYRCPGELFAYTVYCNEVALARTVSPVEAHMILKGHNVDYGG